jgi:hypothetical protein
MMKLMTTKHAGGRPPLIEGQVLRRVTVSLPQAYIDWAYTDGGGNVSRGVRRLLEELDELVNAPPPYRGDQRQGADR